MEVAILLDLARFGRTSVSLSRYLGYDSMTRLPAGRRLFICSFVARFLERLLIRWAPSVVRVVAY
jgi:hypothetical protein